jgi:antitoxin YefM
MVTTVSYTSARKDFARLCDQVANTREIVRIQRRGSEDVMLIAADELRSLLNIIEAALSEHAGTQENGQV